MKKKREATGRPSSSSRSIWNVRKKAEAEVGEEVVAGQVVKAGAELEAEGIKAVREEGGGRGHTKVQAIPIRSLDLRNQDPNFTLLLVLIYTTSYDNLSLRYGSVMLHLKQLFQR